LKLYAPLQNLSNLLYISVLSAITTSVSQFTVGLINSEYSVYFCLGLAAFTLSMVFLSLFEIKKNLDTWFLLLEKDHSEQKKS